MEFASVISTIDNYKKFMLVLGLSMLFYGFNWPVNQRAELQEKIIKSEELKAIIESDKKNITNSIEVLKEKIRYHDSILAAVFKERDSLNKVTFSHEIEFKLNNIQSKIVAIKSEDEAAVKEKKEYLHEIELSSVKLKSLEKEIDNLNDSKNWQNWKQGVFIFGGIVFIIIGVSHLRNTHKENIEFKELELKTKKEQLKKLEKENL